jgi:hypothetical protein
MAFDDDRAALLTWSQKGFYSYLLDVLSTRPSIPSDRMTAIKSLKVSCWDYDRYWPTVKHFFVKDEQGNWQHWTMVPEERD